MSRLWRSLKLVKGGRAMDRIISVGKLFSGGWGAEIKALSEHKRPLTIIQHSKPVAVMLDYQVWCKVEERIDQLVDKVSQLSR